MLELKNRSRRSVFNLNLKFRVARIINADHQPLPSPKIFVAIIDMCCSHENT